MLIPLSSVQVTTLLSGMEGAEGETVPMSRAELEEAVAAQGAVVKAAKAAAKETGAEADAQTAKAEVATLLGLKQQLEATAEPIVAADGAVNYAQDFFGRRAYLTVSGQLNGSPRQHSQHVQHPSCAALRHPSLSAPPRMKSCRNLPSVARLKLQSDL